MNGRGQWQPAAGQRTGGHAVCQGKGGGKD